MFHYTIAIIYTLKYMKQLCLTLDIGWDAQIHKARFQNRFENLKKVLTFLGFGLFCYLRYYFRTNGEKFVRPLNLLIVRLQNIGTNIVNDRRVAGVKTFLGINPTKA